MISRKLLVSAILILSAFPALSVAPSAYSQATTTYTELETFTTLTTNTKVSYSPVSTRYSTSTVKQVLYSESFSIDAATEGYCWERWLGFFSGTAGEHLTGQMSSDQLIDFFLMTKNQFEKWRQGSRCSIGESLIKVTDKTSYNIDLILPQDGDYTFVFEYFVTSAPANINLYVELGPPTIVTVASTVFSTSMETSVSTKTASGMAVRTSTAAQTLELGGNLFYIAIGVVAAIVVIVLLVVLRKRPRKGRPSVCPKCGAALPAKGKFCNKCGAPIE